VTQPKPRRSAPTSRLSKNGVPRHLVVDNGIEFVSSMTRPTVRLAIDPATAKARDPLRKPAIEAMFRSLAGPNRTFEPGDASAQARLSFEDSERELLKHVADFNRTPARGRAHRK